MPVLVITIVLATFRIGSVTVIIMLIIHSGNSADVSHTGIAGTRCWASTYLNLEIVSL